MEDTKAPKDAGIIDVRPVRATYTRNNVAGWAWGVTVGLMPSIFVNAKEKPSGKHRFSIDSIEEFAEMNANLSASTAKAIAFASDLFRRLHPKCKDFQIIDCSAEQYNGDASFVMLVPNMDECACSTGNYN